MSDLAGWTRGGHTAGGETHDTYRRGSGPGVVLVHEIPGITPEVITFAEEVVARGYTVCATPLRPAGAPATTTEILRSIGQVCVNREFVKLRAGVTSPVTGWLRSLAAASTTRSVGRAWERSACA